MALKYQNHVIKKHFLFPITRTSLLNTHFCKNPQYPYKHTIFKMGAGRENITNGISSADPHITTAVRPSITTPAHHDQDASTHNLYSLSGRGYSEINNEINYSAI